MARDTLWLQASRRSMRTRLVSCTFLVPLFIPVDSKSGLVVSQEVFQLIDYIASCKQLLQAFHGSKVLRIL